MIGRGRNIICLLVSLFAPVALSPRRNQGASLEIRHSSAAQSIENPVVQAALASLPKLDLFRFHAKTAPEWRAVDRTVFKSRLDLVHSAFKLLSVADLFALWRSPGAYLAAARSGLKIFFGFFGRRLLGQASILT